MPHDGDFLAFKPLRRDISHLVKKFLPNFCQWSFMISSTLCFLVARMDNHASTAHKPSFSLMWSEPGRSADGRSERDAAPSYTLRPFPETVRLPTCAEALLPAQRQLASVHEVPEELPASWSLVQLHLQSFSHTDTRSNDQK